MHKKSICLGTLLAILFIITDAARADITVTSARIGCLDIQRAPDLTQLLGAACNNKASCSYKAPTEGAYNYSDICPTTQEVSSNMTNTPGEAQFLAHTGHSIHNERPAYWTEQIVRFVGM